MIQTLRSLVEQNSPTEYGTAAVIAVAGLLIVTALRRRGLVLRFFRKRPDGGDGPLAPFVADQYIHSLIPLAYVAVFYVAVSSLQLPREIRHGLNLVGGAVVVFAIFRFLATLSVFSIGRFVDAREAEREGSSRSIRALVPVVEISVWSTALVFLLENFGFHIEAIVAGLGIGGVAVALAAQSVLKDVFGYVAIVLDRPFELGDTIQIDTMTGTVEYIGLRTTHLRAIGGEQLIFANADLTTARLRNWKRMSERRILFQFGVAGRTPAALLREIPGVVRAAVEAQPATRFDRVTFIAFVDAGFTFDAVYYMLSSDYNAYLAAQHEINLAIKDELERRGISLGSTPQTASPAQDAEAATAQSEQAELDESAGHIAGEEVISAGSGAATLESTDPDALL